MKRSTLRWLINPLFLLVTATCNSSDTNIDQTTCLSGVDSDADGLTDDLECRVGSDSNVADTDGDGVSDGDEYKLGTDPTKLDSDGDGVTDGQELAYPKICVATDRNAQRRPPSPCTALTDCIEGETCNGLDPTKDDSDGDGVKDKVEDTISDGYIDFAKGENDPRLWDTDGDGQNDSKSGARICTPDGLAQITRKPIGATQLGHDPAFGTSTTIANATGNRQAVVVDDAVAGVAGLTLSGPNLGADARADSLISEAAVKSAIGGLAMTVVTSVITGRTIMTHEQFPAIQSTYLVTATNNTSASALRDATVAALTGGTAPGGATAGAGNKTFFVDITTVRRGTSLDDIILTIAPTVAYNDVSKSTAIRADDLVNATGVAEGTKELDYVCLGVVANRLPIADIIWTVDTSSSMNNAQARLGNTSTSFFNKMKSAGVDFRVTVFNAGAGAVNFNPTTKPAGYPNGAEFILGNDPNGAALLGRRVTVGSFDATDTATPVQPYPVTTSSEQPAASAIIVNTEYKRRASIGETNQNWVLRPGATKVAFLVTDEPKTDLTTDANDWKRYFSTANNPDITPATKWAPSGSYDAAVLDGIVQYYKNNKFLA